MLEPIAFDRARLRAGFDARTDPQARADFLLAEIESRMFERLEPVRLAPACILELGCGLGRGLPTLLARFPGARCVAADFSFESLRAARRREAALLDAGSGLRRWLARIGAAADPRPRPAAPQWLCCDAQALPLAEASVDLVWSNLVAHWFDDPLAAVGEWYRVVRPRGLVMFSAFGVDTLREVPDSDPPSRPVFQDMHDWGDALSAAGFADPVMETERLTLTFGDAAALARDLDGLLAGLQPRSAAPPAGASAPAEAGDFARAVTIEVVYGHAWCPEAKRRDDGFEPLRFRPKPGAS
ncbi:MAG: methyltransferase domain-containing protein [Lautropia sp.]